MKLLKLAILDIILLVVAVVGLVLVVEHFVPKDNAPNWSAWSN